MGRTNRPNRTEPRRRILRAGINDRSSIFDIEELTAAELDAERDQAERVYSRLMSEEHRNA